LSSITTSRPGMKERFHLCCLYSCASPLSCTPFLSDQTIYTDRIVLNMVCQAQIFYKHQQRPSWAVMTRTKHDIFSYNMSFLLLDLRQLKGMDPSKGNAIIALLVSSCLIITFRWSFAHCYPFMFMYIIQSHCLNFLRV
jgi:hypothetical protein